MYKISKLTLFLCHRDTEFFYRSSLVDDFNDLRTLQDVFHRFKTSCAGKLKQAAVDAFPETTLR